MRLENWYFTLVKVFFSRFFRKLFHRGIFIIGIFTEFHSIIRWMEYFRLGKNIGEKGWFTILVHVGRWRQRGQDLDDRGKQDPVRDVRSYAHESLPLTMKRVRNYLHTLEAALFINDLSSPRSAHGGRTSGWKKYSPG